MPLAPSNPFMSHSPGYGHSHTITSTALSDENSPAASHGQRPPAVHLYQEHKSLLPVAASPTSEQSSWSDRLSKPARALEPQHGHEAPFEQGPDRGANLCLKRYDDRVSGQRSPHPNHATAASNTTIYTYALEGGDVERRADHAISVLLWLACLDPFYSLFSALYTTFAVVGLLITTPFRLCKSSSSSSFEVSAIRTLTPLFRLHLRLMYAESAHDAHELDFAAGRLIAVQIASPVVSIGVAMAEWIAAPFWIFAFVMGNPDGTEGGDDGRATVLAIRNWWERCLLKAVTRQRE